MKIAFVIYEGMTALDFIGVYDPLTRLISMGFLPDLQWELCAFSTPVHDYHGLIFTPTQVGQTLANYDLVILPGGLGTRARLQEEDFLSWLSTITTAPRIASVCSGALLLGHLGLLKELPAATHPNSRELLRQMGVEVVEHRLVDAGKVLTSGGVTAAIDLGLYLCMQLAGVEAAEKIRVQMDYPLPLPHAYQPGASSPIPPRGAQISRKTNETTIAISLNLDGSGQHNIQTGIAFLDHMLSQVAVHGLFDLTLQAQGDLAVDPHHTVEDTALALGQAFHQALRDRAGIVRMASAYCPMDDSLGWVGIDFSGRPYAVVQVEWHGIEVGGIPVGLIAHFLESFTFQAGCNLHARILYGRDNHHQAEALFKAFGRALDAATRLELRRSGIIPSSKGVLS